MAKVNVTYDTVEKTCDATMDGKPIANMHSLFFSKQSDGKGGAKYGMEVGSHEHDEEHDMHKSSYTRAALEDCKRATVHKSIAEYVFPSAKSC